MDSVIEAFDLTGKGQRAQYEMHLDGSITRIGAGIEALRDTLIIPGNNKKNRLPYLQQPGCPNIEDLWDCEKENFSYERCRKLDDILEALANGKGRLDQLEAALRLRDYFCAQKEGIDFCGGCEEYILAVPDSYDAHSQEHLLQKFHRPRSKTMLLWRSVAACLGAMEELKRAGAADGSLVEIVDVQSRGTQRTILELKCTERGLLVPARHAYTEANRKEFYPTSPSLLKNPTINKRDSNQRFVFYTYAPSPFCPEKRQAPQIYWDSKERRWDTELSVGDADHRAIVGNIERSNAPFVLIVGRAMENLIANVVRRSSGKRIFSEPHHENYILNGCALFAARRKLGWPTYFDQCEALSIIVQDVEKEQVIAQELIQENLLCEGGKEIIGERYDGLYIAAQEKFVEFYLAMGEVSRTSNNLRKLKHEFRETTEEKQPLVLFPSVIPGQGLAIVKVEGKPLLKKTEILDLLGNMKEEPETTIASLDDKIKRSFPADTPEVYASETKWRRVQEDVEAYVEGKKIANGSWFCKSTRRNVKAKGLEALERDNVFGTKPGQSIPPGLAEDFQMRLFKKLAFDADNGDAQAIRLVAWTYQRNVPLFSGVVEKILALMEAVATGSDSASRQYYSACANLISRADHMQRFMRAYICNVNRQFRELDASKRVKKVDDWNRALKGVLIFNNSILELGGPSSLIEDDRLCYSCIWCCLKILANYSVRIEGKTKQPRYIKEIISVLFYMLRRRKYSPSFLKDTQPGDNRYWHLRLEEEINELCKAQVNPDCSDAARVYLEYLNGSGTLEGMVQQFGRDDDDDN